MNGVLYFDGNCGMCTRSVNALTRRQRTGDLSIAPFQRPGTAERLGVPADQMLEAAWWQDSSGAVYRGAEAVNAAVSAGFGTRVPLRVYRVPGMRQLQNAIYRWIATHRYRFPGTTPHCAARPGDC
ncbi:thiol-disulfide oxidoreductase DCC family protein [Mycobacterium sp. NPDC003449]